MIRNKHVYSRVCVGRNGGMLVWCSIIVMSFKNHISIYIYIYISSEKNRIDMF